MQTGQVVKAGDLLVNIDQRIPKNDVATAQSNLEVAQARLLNAHDQKERSEVSTSRSRSPSRPRV